MGLLDYFALKNIIVTRNEADTKTGYVGIDVNGTVQFLNALKQKITTLEISDRDNYYQLNGYNGNKYDISVHEGFAYVDFINFAEGQEITCIVNNLDEGPCLFIFGADEVIKWLDNALPQVETNAMITFYKSNNIIYAEIKKPYIGGGGSDSGS